MGYHTVKMIFDVGADDLHPHLKHHVALYKPRKRVEEFEVEVYAGLHCSAIASNHLACPEMLLTPIGHQLAALWMDVRYQDGDSWEFSCYTGFDHELSHYVNPWPYNPEFVYDAKAAKGIDYRINKLCKLLPQFADAVRPYMLLWEYPKDIARPNERIARTGKARETDRFEYGDAMQYLDFLSCFGIDIDKPVHKVQVRV